MKDNKIVILVSSVFVLCLVVFFVWEKRFAADTQPIVPAPIKPSVTKVPMSSVPPLNNSPKYPIESVKNLSDKDIDKEPIPKIGDSDQKFQSYASEIFSNVDVKDIFLFKNFINRFVVFVDSAAGKIIPTNMLPVNPAPDKFIVIRSGDSFELSEENYKRYKEYIDVANAANLKKAVIYYRRMYPLIQSSYKELGEDGYFNDRLIEMIDIALSTPEIKGPIKLLSSNSQYEFVDPKLESLMAIQKILIRMGPNNSKIVKTRLKELRKLLIK